MKCPRLHANYSQPISLLAEEMGAQLERTALSTNVRERLDFSCALLDGKGIWWHAPLIRFIWAMVYSPVA